MKNSNLITVNEPNSMVSESYKMFRTNLSYLNIDKDNKIIVFASAVEEEGKSTSICNTAISFAMVGKKVLLVECDLRRPRIHELFGLQQKPGLTNALAFKKQFSEVIQTYNELNNLHIITCGDIPPNPAEVLDSNTFHALIEEARNQYDIVLIDAPPVLTVTDAVLLGKVVDGVVLIAAANESKIQDIKRARRTLEKVGISILGVLLTKVKPKKNRYSYYKKKQGKGFFLGAKA